MAARDKARAFFVKICEKMNEYGDVEWNDVIRELDYTKRSAAPIRRELHTRRWTREVSEDEDQITEIGLAKAREFGIISAVEYDRRRRDLFNY